MKSTDLKKCRYVQGGTTDVLPGRLGWWERRTFSKDASDEEFVITTQYHQRPGKLASDRYGSDDYEFFILQYNGILDITTEFIAGNKILLPTLSRMSMDLMTKTAGGKVI